MQEPKLLQNGGIVSDGAQYPISGDTLTQVENHNI